MDQMINDFFSSKNLALVGFSRSGKKFGNAAYKELKKKDYNLFPIHPTESEIDGVKCYPNLTSLKNKIDGVFISIPSEKAEAVLDEAKSIGIRNVWLQKGAESEEVINHAKDLGLNMVTGKCILMYAEPVKSVHKFHRTIVKLFGKL